MRRGSTEEKQPFDGTVILIAIVVAVLSWAKSEILDKVTPGAWVIMTIAVLAYVAIKVWTGFRRRQRQANAALRLGLEAEAQAQASRQRHNKYMAWGVKRTVLVATHQNQVSPR